MTNEWNEHDQRSILQKPPKAAARLGMESPLEPMSFVASKLVGFGFPPSPVTWSKLESTRSPGSKEGIENQKHAGALLLGLHCGSLGDLGVTHRRLPDLLRICGSRAAGAVITPSELKPRKRRRPAAAGEPPAEPRRAVVGGHGATAWSSGAILNWFVLCYG